MSADIMAGFKQYIAARPSSGALDMSVLVLTSGFWPSYRTFDCLLPSELLQAQQVKRCWVAWAWLCPACLPCTGNRSLPANCCAAGVCRLLSVQAWRPQVGVAQLLQQLPSARAVCLGSEGAAGLRTPGLQ